MTEYNPAAIETKWQEFWLNQGIFKTPRYPGEKKLYVLDMFPYPSGAGLHIGHPLGYTATDIYSRFKRMQGYSVLHPMGYDAFGLPAEQHAVNTGEHPSKITFESCATFTKQMRAIGLSYDWDRELATCTDDYYKWTQWIFLKLYNSWFDPIEQKAKRIDQLPIPTEIQSAGAIAVQEYQASKRLAYVDEALVNWCPALGTVLANEEVIDGRSERGSHEVVRKPMRQWMLRITAYAERLISELDGLDWPEPIKEQQRNWIGKRFGTEVVFKVDNSPIELRAFTTRPDTLGGVSFVVISPEHPLIPSLTHAAYQTQVEGYIDQARRLSDKDRQMDNRKKTGEFTGSYLINPINGEKVPLYVADYVLMNFGTGVVMGVPAHDDRDFDFAKVYNLPIKPVLAPSDRASEVFQQVVAGEVCWIEQGEMLEDPEALSSGLNLKGLANTEAASLITNWLASRGLGNQVVTYRLRDWVFSRQRYWGEPIPIINWEDGTTSSLSESDLPLMLPSVTDYKPAESGESPLAKATEWLNVTDPVTGKKGIRETNTMPQWAGSCWYYLRFIDPKNSEAGWSPELEKAWMPVDLYVGGAEHAVLHLLYSRFWHKVLFDLGYVSTVEPFKRLFNQGMIQSYAYRDARGVLVPADQVIEDESGVCKKVGSEEVVEKIIAKMSKSLKNVINPTDIINQYGADTLRLYLMFMGPVEASKPWDTKAITGTYRFLRKAWSLVVNPTSGEPASLISEAEESLEVKRLLHKTIDRVSSSLEGLRYNTAISGLMEFINDVSGKPLSKSTVTNFVLLLSPLAPHITEELWQRLGYEKSLAYESWPQADSAMLVDESVTVVIQVKGKKRGTVDVAPAISEDELKTQVINRLSGTEFAVTSSNKFITVFNPGTKIPRLVNVV